MLPGFILYVFPIIAVFSLIIYTPFCFGLYRRVGKRPFTRYLTEYAFIGCCLSLLYLTILWGYPNFNFFSEYHYINLKPFVWVSNIYGMGMENMKEQLLLNIAMFVPYGFLLPMTFKKLRSFPKVAILVFVTTLGIETLQYFIGRSADIDDVIMNFIGGVTGFLCYALLKRLFPAKV